MRTWLIEFGLVFAVVIGIASPMLFTDKSFGPDFPNSIWLVSQQAAAIRHGAPTLYLNVAPYYDPLFAFYGAAPFATAGALAWLLGGHVVAAFEVATVLALLMAYAGLLWCARLAGIRGLLAHAPAVAFLTSAYYITGLYSGAWGQFVGYSAIPLLVASAWSILRSERLRVGQAAALVVATIFFTGSHNVVLLWGVFISGALVAAVFALRAQAKIQWRRLGVVALLVALSAGVNAWFLFPDVLYGMHTGIVGKMWGFEFDTLSNLLSPFRVMPHGSTVGAGYAQYPVLFLTWAIVVGAVFLRRRDAKVAAALMACLVGLTALIAATPIWAHLPRVFRAVQFPMRLVGFASLLVAALVMVTLRASSGRAAHASLAAIAALSIGISIWQLWVPQFGNWVHEPNRGAATLATPPGTWYDQGSFRDNSTPLVKPGGDLVATDILGGPGFVKIGGGFERVGHDAQGLVVVKRTGPGPMTVTANTNPVIVGGRWLSIFCALMVVLLLGGLGLRSVHQERDAAEPRVRHRAGFLRLDQAR